MKLFSLTLLVVRITLAVAFVAISGARAEPLSDLSALVGAISARVASANLSLTPCPIAPIDNGYVAATEKFLSKLPDGAHSPKQIQDLWKLRLLLRTKLGFDGSLACVHAVRSLTQKIRFDEEFLVGWPEDQDLLADQTLRPALLGGKFPELVTNPSVKDLSLESGDIVLTFSSTSVSAGIAAMTVGGAMDHVMVVYKDPATGQAFIVDNNGDDLDVVIHPAIKALNASLARAQVFRFYDKTVAARAAKAIYDRARAAISQHKPIRYDFGFDLGDGGRQMYCAEVAYDAFFAATIQSAHPVRLPFYKPEFLAGGAMMTKQMGIRKPIAFAPSDLDVDPRFTLVAEWRDATQVDEVHLVDRTIRDIYIWVSDLGYRFLPTEKSMAVKYLAWTLRRTPYFGERRLGHMIPATMPQTFLEKTFDIMQVSDAISKEVHKAKDLPRLTTQIDSVLESIRASDEAKQRDWSAKNQWFAAQKERPVIVFHDLFARPLIDTKTPATAGRPRNFETYLMPMRSVLTTTF